MKKLLFNLDLVTQSQVTAIKNICTAFSAKAFFIKGYFCNIIENDTGVEIDYFTSDNLVSLIYLLLPPIMNDSPFIIMFQLDGTIHKGCDINKHVILIQKLIDVGVAYKENGEVKIHPDYRCLI